MWSNYAIIVISGDSYYPKLSTTKDVIIGNFLCLALFYVLESTEVIRRFLLIFWMVFICRIQFRENFIEITGGIQEGNKQFSAHESTVLHS